MSRPRFTLKGILGVTAALAVPLGMLNSNSPTLADLGVLTTLPIFGGCIGFVVVGWRGAGVGILIGCIIDLALAFLLYVADLILMPT